MQWGAAARSLADLGERLCGPFGRPGVRPTSQLRTLSTALHISPTRRGDGPSLRPVVATSLLTQTDWGDEPSPLRPAGTGRHLSQLIRRAGRFPSAGGAGLWSSEPGAEAHIRRCELNVTLRVCIYLCRKYLVCLLSAACCSLQLYLRVSLGSNICHRAPRILYQRARVACGRLSRPRRARRTRRSGRGR